MNVRAAAKQILIDEVDAWLRQCVLQLSLCPYARVPYQAGRVRLVIAAHASLNEVFHQEVALLESEPEVETTLVIVDQGLSNFLDFNDCYGAFEDELISTGLDQHFQLAGFHPAYRFAGEAEGDASHYTNRAPHPIIQLLRADSVARAVEQGDTLAIPEHNVKTLRSLSEERLRSLFPWVD